MISRDGTPGRSDEEERVVVFSVNFDVSFVPCLSRVDGAFEFHVKSMTVSGGIFCVIENCLI